MPFPKAVLSLLALPNSFTSASPVLSKLFTRSLSWPSLSFKTVSFHPPKLNITKSGEPLAPGLLFLTPLALDNSTEDAALIVSDTGDVIWNSPLEEYSNLVVTSLHSLHVLTVWTGILEPTAVGYGRVSIMDCTYTEIYSICPQLDLVAANYLTYACYADSHESYVTQRGSIIVTAYNMTSADLTAINGPKDGFVFDALFYEIDIKTQEILFRWSALEAGISIEDSHLPLGTSGSSSDPYNWFTVNSVQSVGNGYLVNGRNLWTTYMLNSAGAIEWTFEESYPPLCIHSRSHQALTTAQGQTGGSFGPLPPSAQFSWEHDVRITSENLTHAQLHFFNDANAAPPLNGSHPSTGRSYMLDLQTHTATLFRDVSDPHSPIYTDTQGSFAVLPNNNSLIGYGQVPVIKEFGPQGDVRMTIQFGAADASSYRVYREVWEGTPAEAPAVVIQGGSVYMSWNGVTGVTAWGIWEGGNNRTLVERRVVPSTEFETMAEVGPGASFVQVGAYRGDVLVRKSAVVAVG